MSKLTHRGNTIPKDELRKAYKSWLKVIIPYGFNWALTFFPMGLIVAATARKQNTHPQGKKLKAFHSTDYIADGASGDWAYWNSNVEFVRNWNNYEDGTLGEPSGKTSARVGGNERTFWNQYKWICRNPFNWGKRTIPRYRCLVNNCDIEYWGDKEVNDKVYGSDSWHFCKATDRNTGDVYYYYRSVKFVSQTEVRQAAIGFKIKPSHAEEVQDSDDLDKAFTIRIPVKTTID